MKGIKVAPPHDITLSSFLVQMEQQVKHHCNLHSMSRENTCEVRGTFNTINTEPEKATAPVPVFLKRFTTNQNLNTSKKL